MAHAQPARQALTPQITATLTALAQVASGTGQEGPVREYLHARLQRLELTDHTDSAGNLIVRVPAAPLQRDGEPPVLLSAHMDRVAPGRAHTPRVADGIMRSDGSTNLGADNSAGIAIIVHTVEALRARGLPHPPLLLLFTASEEIGLVGAKAFDGAPFGIHEGIVFDNAGAPGTVVTRAATYIAFDVLLRGRGGHPGMTLAGTASAIEMFRAAPYPAGELDGGATRLTIGQVQAGSARNAVPVELRALGEIRTLLQGAARADLLTRVESAFIAAAAAAGGSGEVRFDPHCDGYQVDTMEPLLVAWQAAWAARGHMPETATSFVGSDTSALRGQARVFTVSTGAMNEHSSEECVALEPLAELAEAAAALLSAYHSGQPSA